jgi:hypothetical protein
VPHSAPAASQVLGTQPSVIEPALPPLPAVPALPPAPAEPSLPGSENSSESSPEITWQPA